MTLLQVPEWDRPHQLLGLPGQDKQRAGLPGPGGKEPACVRGRPVRGRPVRDRAAPLSGAHDHPQSS